MSDLRVQDLMATTLHTIDGMATVGEAMAVMKRHGVSSLIVSRRGDDDEVGVVDVVRLATEVVARNRAPERVHVYEVMTKPVVTVSPRMQARYALRLLAELRLTRTVVANDDREPVGLVTLRDLVLADI